MKKLNGFPFILSLCIMVLTAPFLLDAPAFAAGKTVEDMMASTVHVTCGDLTSSFAAGSGFVVDKQEHVATNHHVIDCSEQGGAVNIVLDRDNIIPAKVIWSSQDKDLAVLEPQAPLKRPVVTFTRSEDVKVADHVYVMGFPGSADPGFIDSSSFFTVKVAQGIVSAKVKLANGENLYQTDAPINHGNSGGPMFTDNGAVIGINSLGIAQTGIMYDENGQPIKVEIAKADNIAWAIQVDELLVELDKLGIKYQTEGRAPKPGPEPHGTSIFVFIAIGLGGLAVLLAFLAFILSLTKRGRVIVKEVSRRVIPQSLQSRNQAPPVIKPVVTPPVPGPDLQQIAAKPYLVGVSGPYGGQKFQVSGTITMGRSPAGSQIIIQSSIVSSNHCTLSYDPMNKVFYLTDLQSTNGTFIGAGQRLAPHVKTTLQSGQRFYLGNQEITFEVRLEN